MAGGSLRWLMADGYCVSCPLPDAEAGLSVPGQLLVHLYVAHPRAWRSVPDMALEPLDRVGLALGRNFHPAIGQVSHPAVQAFTRRRRFGEIAEADALDAAANHI